VAFANQLSVCLATSRTIQNSTFSNGVKWLMQCLISRYLSSGLELFTGLDVKKLQDDKKIVLLCSALTYIMFKVICNTLEPFNVTSLKS